MNKTPREVYRDLKPKYPNALLAFSSGEMIDFVHADAHEVARPNGYDVASVHKLRLPEIKRRLGCLGREVVIVSRTRTPSGKVSFQVVSS